MLTEQRKEKKDKVWNIICRNEKNYIKNKSFSQINNKKSTYIKSKKLVPIYKTDEKTSYERKNIIHKFKIFKNEQEKFYTNEKLNSLFHNLFLNKNEYFFKSHKENNNNSIKKFYNIDTLNDILNNNNNDINEDININYEYMNNNFPNTIQNIIEDNKNNVINDNNNNEEILDNGESENSDYDDPIESEEKIVKKLEKQYNFYNNNDNIHTQDLNNMKIFVNQHNAINKKNNSYLPYMTYSNGFYLKQPKNKIKSLHLMNLNTEDNYNVSLTSRRKYDNYNNNKYYNTFNSSMFNNTLTTKSFKFNTGRTTQNLFRNNKKKEFDIYIEKLLKKIQKNTKFLDINNLNKINKNNKRYSFYS